MTDQTPEAPTLPTAPPAPAPTPAPTPSKARPATEEQPKRYAAYDTTYLRFVGDVHATKSAAREDAKAHGSKAFEIREV